MPNMPVKRSKRTRDGVRSLGGFPRFQLLVPEVFEADLVDRSTLDDYELWFFVSSLLGSFFSGFLVALIERPNDGALLVFTILLGLKLCGSISVCFHKRRLLRDKRKRVMLR